MKYIAFATLLALTTVGCQGNKSKSEQNLSKIPSYFQAKNFKGISNMLASEPGYSFSPEEAESFLQAYVSDSPRTVSFKILSPKAEDITSTKTKFQFTVILDGVKETYPITFASLSAGNGTWVTPVSPIVETAIGLYYPTSEDRLKHISSALKASGLKFYGKPGHYTDAARIDSFLRGDIEKKQLYFANLP